jgi:HKD family nuclease
LPKPIESSRESISTRPEHRSLLTPPTTSQPRSSAGFAAAHPALLDTALLTNSPGEPRVGSQILAEIHSADRIDVVMAFIRRSGIAPLAEASDGTARRPACCGPDDDLHGSTEASALDLLQNLGADVRVSYDTTGTRLHAKSWLFHRDSGFSTAYIGSSNLTHSALVTGSNGTSACRRT